MPVRQYTAVDTTHVVADSLCLLPHRQGGVRELVLESIVHVGRRTVRLPSVSWKGVEKDDRVEEVNGWG